MAMMFRKMHLKWKPLFSLHSSTYSRIRNDILACLCQRNFSTQVTIATSSSSLSFLPKCTFSTLCQNKVCVAKKTRTCVMNPTLRYINSGQTSTINSMVFCDENKARAIKFMLSIKPSTRRRPKNGKTPKTAGVCVPLCNINGIPSVLFTLRSKHMSSHRGEICFPGGLKEDGDKDVSETALREMNEEIGIDPKDVDVWGKLIPIPNRTGEALATATVAFIKNVDVDKLNEQCNKNEVELVFTVPISHLCDPSNNGYTRFDPQKSSKKAPYIMPVFKGSGFHIWGMTALFTDMTIRALLPKHHKSIYMYF